MQFYTIRQISEMSGKSQKTVRRHIAAKKLKSEKIQNKYRISEKDYKEWINGSVFEEDDKGVFTKQVKTEVDDSYNINWADISKEWKIDGWKNKEERNGYKFIDLFSGAGGLSCGLVMAGFTPVASVEIMPEAVQTYKYNFVTEKGFKEKVETRDIRSQDVKKQLYKTIENQHIDLIVGGFPCQGFSMAGNRVVSDPRNSLYLEMLEIVKKVKPDYVVMENVEGILSFELDNFEGLNKDIYKNELVIDILKKEFDNIGYKIKYKVLTASDYGVPQQRRRVVFLGYKKDEKKIPEFPQRNMEKITVKESIGDLEFLNDNEEEKKYKIKEFSTYQIESKKGRTPGADGKTIESKILTNHKASKHTELTKERFALLKQGETLKELFNRLSKEDKEKYATRKNICRKIKENDLSPTVVTLPDDLVHYSKNRIMTVRELARLQSFDDSFEFLGKRTTGGKERKKELPQYTQVGNAVPPLLAKAVAEEIMKVLK